MLLHLISSLALTLTLSPPAAPTPPQAERRPHPVTLHGHTLTDDYFWLREREDPKVLAHLAAENTYCDAVLKHTEALQKALYDEMLARVQQTDMSVPYLKDGYWYSTATREGQAHPLYIRTRGALDGPVETLLDVNELAKDYPNVHASPLGVSPDTKTLAYAVDPTGGRVNTIHFKDLTTGKDLPDTLDNAAGDLVWAADNQTVFFTTLDPAIRTDKVWRYRLGSAKPELVYHEQDERFFAGLGKPLSDKVILMALGSMTTSEVWFIPADQPSAEFKVIAPRRDGVEYSVDQHGDDFYILHNDGALNFTLVRTPMATPSRDHWTTVIPHSADSYLRGLLAFKDHLVIASREHGLSALRIRDFKTGAEHAIDMPEASFELSLSTNAEFDTTKVRFEYSSPVTPPSVFDYDMVTRERTLLKEQPVPGGYDRTKYEVRRVLAPARDGEQIPVTLVFKKGTTPTGDNPTVLYGYGSYGADTDPWFSNSSISLLDRGVVYAVAQIRGGSEKGRAWYEHGRLMNKLNTFNDFIDAAEYLVKEKWTNPKRLAINGGSAGGLLVGACTNMRPDLFRAVVADVPFVDLMNTMLDPDLPLTVIEYEQWGNPHEKDAFEYMLKYSPYDNVHAAAYPRMLVKVGLHDTNVSYWEGAKWAARLRTHTTSGEPVLLKINMDAGHGGASDRYKALEERALSWAFVLDALGVK